MAQEFENFIRENECLNEQRGKIMERNSCRTPWSQKVDISLRQSLPELPRAALTLQLDIFNFAQPAQQEVGPGGAAGPQPDVRRPAHAAGPEPHAGADQPVADPVHVQSTVQQQGAFLKQQTLASNFYQMQFTLKYTF